MLTAEPRDRIYLEHRKQKAFERTDRIARIKQRCYLFKGVSQSYGLFGVSFWSIGVVVVQLGAIGLVLLGIAIGGGLDAGN